MPTIPLLLDAVRTPFLDTAGAYSPLQAHELAGRLLASLLDRVPVDPADVGAVALGTVVHETDTSNVARSAWLDAGLPPTVPAWTTSMAGLSAVSAVQTVADAIALDRVELGVAGGVETFSDVPIRLGRTLRRTAMKLRQARSVEDQVRALAELRPRDLTLDLIDFPASADDATGLSMGDATERMAKRYGVDRHASDLFAATSHARAVAAWAAGRYDASVVPITVGGTTVAADDGPRADSDVDVLARLSPSFGGVVTAGTASRFTDGAAACLLGSAAAADRLGVEPLAALVDTVFVGVEDPLDDHLLGPAVAIPRLLARAGLTMDDVGVFEVHEAFAAQVLCNQVALAEDAGAIPEGRLNAWGGSIALGNPFGATGARLLDTAARRLHAEDAEWAVVASCAGGGLGAATLLRRA